MDRDDIRAALAADGHSIYDVEAELEYDLDDLETLLDEALRGADLDLPLRTRSKRAKELVADALGYKVPPSFKKTQPRFPGQKLDVFVQKADNLQIWGEEVDPERRYALIRVNESGVVTQVRVVPGEAVALWDTTGTLTAKYQASRIDGGTESLLAAPADTEEFRRALDPAVVSPDVLARQDPASPPTPGRVLPIAEVAARLESLVGRKFDDPGATQERLRGEGLHRLACQALGLGPFRDTGQFPDVRSQALEVKLQMSPTIDLGLVSPDSDSAAESLGNGLTHRDTRYAVAFAEGNGESVRVLGVVTVTGARFFEVFRKFEGNVTNRKLQMKLPADLFQSE